MGGSGRACPEVKIIVLEGQVPEIERVKKEDMVVGSFAKCNGEPTSVSCRGCVGEEQRPQ
jgi:hypothetical protein